MKTRIGFASLAPVVAFAVLPTNAWALFSSITPTSFAGLAQSDINTLIQTVGIAGDHHAYMPASALGMAIGIDLGVDVTYLAFPAAFSNAIATASGQSASQLPSGLPIPKLNVHKGLPFGFGIGGSFTTFSTNGQTVVTSIAGELQWTFLGGTALPAIAVRGSYSSNSLYFLNANTLTADAIVSKDLVVIEPYVGGGMQYWSGSLSVPSGVTLPPTGISTNANGVNMNLLGGLMLKLAFFKIDAEADYSTAGITTFGGKVSFGF